MNAKFSLAKIVETLVPFIIGGMTIALFLGLLFMFSYILIWGVIIGSTLWLASVIKQFLCSHNKTSTEAIKKNSGRIIEHNDKK